MKKDMPSAGKTVTVFAALQRGMVLLCSLLIRFFTAVSARFGGLPALPAPTPKDEPAPTRAEELGNAVILETDPSVSREYVDALVRRTDDQMHEIAYLESIYRSMSDAVIVAGLDGTISRFNKGAQDIFEIEEVMAVGDNLFRFCADASQDGGRLSELLIKNGTTGVVNLRTEFVGFSGKRTPALLTLNFVETEGQRTAIVAVIKDNSEVEALTRVDPLTSIANRREFDRRIKDEHERMKRGHMKAVSMLFIDVDHFGDFNKKYGHQVGDEVLKRVGEVLQGCCRMVDTPARYGGEEFVIILPNTDESGAWSLGERVRRGLAEACVPVNGTKLSITASIGVRTHRPADGDVKQFVDEANKAMLHAKQTGRNRTISFERLKAA
jgi:diguanylate cyclase (GGDEF)-like protein/PAS domain S-box-containing protein